MKKINRVKGSIQLISAATICIFLLVFFSYSGYLKANDETSGYQFKVIKNEDSTAAVIVGDDANVRNNVDIKQVVDPDGNPVQSQDFNYHVIKNGKYSFMIYFSSETGDHVENVEVTVTGIRALKTDTDKSNQKDAEKHENQQPALPSVAAATGEKGKHEERNNNPAEGSKTVTELKAEKKSQAQASKSFLVPMYIDQEDTSQGNYSFPGGDIINIADQTFQGLPYRFLKAEIEIKEGDSYKTYDVDYYDEVNGVKYYSLIGDGDEGQDFEVAYEVPEGSELSFIFTLNTQKFPVTINNDKEAQGFEIQYIAGIHKNEDGSLSAMHNSLVKLILHYPAGYYTDQAPAGKKNVGIEFSDSSLSITKVENKKERTISYAFTYPDNPVTLKVVGDEDKTGLMYGVYDGTTNFQNLEQGSNWWKTIDGNGNYIAGKPYFGNAPSGGDRTVMKIRGGLTMPVKMEGDGVKNIAGGSFDYGQELNFEYQNLRVNANGKPPYFFWPSPSMSLCYFPNGADITKEMPISETFTLWSPNWLYDPDVSGSAPITKQYTAGNGAEITITVKRSTYGHINTSTPGVALDYPNYQVHVNIKNMKNSFYIKTQGSGSVQGPHYFRALDNISMNVTNNIPDSYFLEDNGAEDGGNSGEIVQTPIRGGGMFLDKRAVYNKNITGGGVPWETDPLKPFFKFVVTPKWGYTIPRVESYETEAVPVMLNKPIEIEKAELEKQNNTSYPALTMGNYSWFHDNAGRDDAGPFQYVLFMPVESLKKQHNMHAIDVKVDKITGMVSNNTAYSPNSGSNNIVNGDGTFDLLTKDQIVFNPDFKPQEQEGKVFVGFSATITAPDNPLLPSDYELVLMKDVNNTIYFKPGDVISISDFFRRDTAILQNSWNKNHNLTAVEQDRLNLIMFSAKLNVKMNAIYRDASSSEGQLITGHVNKYLQDITKENLEYAAASAGTQSLEAIKGTNIFFNKFAETFENPADNYTYYLNETTTTSKNKVTSDGEELASVKYDRGLTVTYLNNDKNPFSGIHDSNVYRTYSPSNKAVIRFPEETQYPYGKVFAYWTVEELDDSGNWISRNGLKIKETEQPAVYTFSSGSKANNKSIRLTAVWKDISPNAYITIPKHIQLTEKGTNLSPRKDYAGSKITISYQSVNGSDKRVVIDVLKSFDLSRIDDPARKIKVSAYGTDGSPLTNPGIDAKYARIGEFGIDALTKDIWFNTKTQNGNEVYKGSFTFSSDAAAIKENTLFYISAASQ